MSSPLTLVLPVIPGTSLETIGTAVGQAWPQVTEALTAVGTVHFARILLLDRASPNLQPGTTASDSLVIAVITEFDGDFTTYIQDFVSQMGQVFNALLPFVVGGSALVPVADHVDEFVAVSALDNASQHPPNTGTFYQAYSYTVQSILANGS
jgi:hypothetical protein